MRITWRTTDNHEYWRKRWASVAVDAPMENEQAYPLQYALMALSLAQKSPRIVEIGCGNGRILRYFHERKHNILGLDFIADAVANLRTEDPTLKVSEGNVLHLAYPDGSFDVALAFGLYHNLPWDAQAQALAETRRVLADEGILCASFRTDNIANTMNDWMSDHKKKCTGHEKREFHKLNLSAHEFRRLLTDNGFEILSMHYVTNMPVLYKFSCFRHAEHKSFDEHKGRREGYLLNPVGSFLWAGLRALCPHHVCNVSVALARKKH